MPGFPELAQTHVHQVGDAIQPSYPLSSPSPSAFNLSQYQGLFKLWFSLAYRPRDGIARSRGCSVAQSYPALCNFRHCSMPGFPVLHHLLKFAKLMSFESVIPSNYLILCLPLLLLSSVFPSIRVFLSESARCIRWPQYWSFSFSISPSNVYSFRFDFR